MAKDIPQHLAVPATKQQQLRYTGDGTTVAAGYPADPDAREFWLQISDDELERLLASGLYEHVGEYDAAADAADAAARGPEAVS